MSLRIHLLRLLHTPALIATMTIGFATVGHARGDGEPDPFRDAARAPANADIYVGIDEPARVTSLLLQSPARPAIESIFERSSFGKAWRALSEEVGLDRQQLFDAYLSRRLVIVAEHPTWRRPDRADGDRRHDRRADGGGDTKRERDGRERRRPGRPGPRWVLMSEVERGDATRLFKSLDSRVARWVGDVPIHSADRGSLRLTYQDGWLHISGAEAEYLMEQLVAVKKNDTLADDDAFREARLVGRGQIGAFVRSRRDERGWNAVSISLTPTGVEADYLRRLAEPIDADRIDTGGAAVELRERLAPHVLYVEVEQFSGLVDDHDHPRLEIAGRPLRDVVESFPTLREMVGPTMVTILDTVRIVDGETGAEVETPTIAVGLQLVDAADGASELDRFMLATAEWLDKACDDDCGLQIPSLLPRDSQALRQVDLSPLAETMEVIPGGERMELVWSTVGSGADTWWLGATNRVTHGKVAKLMLQGQDEESGGKAIGAGSIAGVRIAGMLGSWPSLSGDTSDRDPRRSGMQYLRTMLSAVERMDWDMSRTSDVSYEANITLRWARPPTPSNSPSDD